MAFIDPNISWQSLNTTTLVETSLNSSGWRFGRVDAGTMSQTVTETTMDIWNNKGNTTDDAKYLNACQLSVVDLTGRNDDSTNDLVTGVGTPTGNPWVEVQNIGYSLTTWTPIGSKFNATTSHYDAQVIAVGANGTTSYGGNAYVVTNGAYNPGSGGLTDVITGYRNDGTVANSLANYARVKVRINIPITAKSGQRDFALKLSYYTS